MKLCQCDHSTEQFKPQNTRKEKSGKIMAGKIMILPSMILPSPVCIPWFISFDLLIFLLNRRNTRKAGREQNHGYRMMILYSWFCKPFPILGFRVLWRFSRASSVSVQFVHFVVHFVF